MSKGSFSAAAVAVAVLVVASPAVPRAAAQGGVDAADVTYQPPVDAPIVDAYRPPAERWGPGNRGIDYATPQGTPVLASAPGEVVFAGPVGGSLHVVVLHPGGIRTSYSFLDRIDVRRGRRVEQGDVVGSAGSSLHFGVRIGETYVDPMLLLVGAPVEAYLVPFGDVRPQSEAAERNALQRGIAAIRGPAAIANGQGMAAIGWLAGAGSLDAAALEASAGRLRGVALERARLELARMVAVGHALRAAPVLELPPGLADSAARLATILGAWHHRRAHCTPPGADPPPVPGRRIAVLVAGLGSSTERAGVWALADPRRLGYADGSVVRFSYRGGTADERPYAGADTYGDLWVAAARLRDLIDELHEREPQARIDVIAHSQGGLVARAALSLDPEAAGLEETAASPVATLVTLASPHVGASLAGSALETQEYLPAHVMQRAIASVAPSAPGPDSTALGQLAEGSPFLGELARRQLPSGLRVVSIAARRDLVVPPPRSRLPEVPLVVVDTDDASWLRAHHALPGSEAGRREVRLALAGRPPTCESLADVLADAAIGEALLGLEFGERRIADTLAPLPGPEARDRSER